MNMTTSKNQISFNPIGTLAWACCLLIAACSNPASLEDIDEDGIPDKNEMPGEMYASLPLYDWGARPGKPDVFLHIFYMRPPPPEEGEPTPESLLPLRETLNKTRDTYANYGITLHMDVGDLFSSEVNPRNFNLSGRSHEIPFRNLLILLDEETKKYTPKIRTSLENIHDRNRLSIFHFAFFGSYVEEIPRTTEEGITTFIYGVAGLGGRVSLIGTQAIRDKIDTFPEISLIQDPEISLTEAKMNFLVNLQSSTLVHELGHNFGLRHGGDEDLNNKPNYLSVMNYLYLASGVQISTEDCRLRSLERPEDTKEIPVEAIPYLGIDGLFGCLPNNPIAVDFEILLSDGSGLPLDENRVSETIGLGRSESVPIDFNGINKIEQNIRYDLNRDDKYTVLRDHNDPAGIILPYGPNGLFGDSSRAIQNSGGDRRNDLSGPVEGVTICRCPKGQ